MNKFEKRLRKFSKNTHNALVIGTAFGVLAEIIPIYDTVFVISDVPPQIKSKKLIYRENSQYLNLLPAIDVMFFDISTLDNLETFSTVWRNANTVILIQGHDPIGRHLSLPLYHSGWRCTNLQELYHVWEEVK